MPSPNEITVKLKTIADVSDVLENAKQIQNVLNKLKLPENVKSSFDQLFKDIEKSGGKATSALTKGLNDKNNAKAYTQGLKELDSLTATLSKNFNKIDFSKLKFDIDPAKLKEVQQVIQNLQKDLSNVRADALERVSEVMQKKPSGAKAWENFFTALSKGDEGISEAEAALKRLNTELEKADNRAGGAGQAAEQSEKWREYSNAIQICQEALSVYKGETDSTSEKTQQLQQALEKLGNLAVEANTEGAEAAKQFGGEIKKSAEETNHLTEEETKLTQRTQDVNSQLESFKNKTKYFFGMENAVRLLRRTLTDVFNTVKELDAVMTETAVVTDFSVGDMWEQLPEYTKRANKLGVAIKDVYEASTLYYQQGLKTNQVMALTNETLKMARIGGLDAAIATDRMTNALRGFNMEINELNAQRINDVYSKLAAISASDTDEISTAMTKVASLAHNANMEFETTSALLTQIIETTRESPETAGTALKTIIARFSEVKSLFSEGQLLGTDEEGEEVNVNKVSEALRTAGINLNEYLTGAKGLDDIFLELSSKWDSLDQIQQRYIATMAAGSRQQSRFIAMMQDYSRTTELVNAANGAAGASEEQFGKTLESLETKLAKLKNAWTEFTMGLANQEIIKTVVNVLTWIVNIVNKLLNIFGKLPGVLGDVTQSIATILTILGGLKLGGAIINKVLNKFGPIFLKQGTEAGLAYGKGVATGINLSSPKYIAATNKLANAQKNLDMSQNLINNNISMYGERSAQASAAVFAQAEVQKKLNLAQQEYYEVLGLNTEQAATFETLRAAGISVDEAATIAQQNLTKAQIESIVIHKQMGKGILANIAATIVENGQRILGVVGLKMQAAATLKAWVAKKLENATIKEKIMLTAIELGIILAVVAAIGIIIGLIYLVIKAIKDSTPEAKLEAAKEAADDAAEAANNAAEAYKNLSDSWDSLSDKYKALEGMTRGTEEWRKAVQEINSEVLDLMDNYDDLEVEMDANGVLQVNNMDKVLKQQNETAIKASSGAIIAKQNVIKAQNTKDFSDLSDFWTTQGAQAGQWVYDDESSDWQGNQVATEDIARKIANGELIGEEAIQQYADKLGVTLSVTEDNINALQKFGESLLEADVKMDAYYTALSANAVALADIPEELSNEATNFIDNDKTKKAVETAITETKKQSENKELDKDEAYNKYWIDQYGAENVEISNNGQVKYKDEDGKWQTIKKEDAIEQYSGAKATEENARAVEKFTANINELSDIQKKIYKQREGGALTKKDITELTGGKTYEDIKDLTQDELRKQLEGQLHTEYRDLTPEMQAAYGSEDEYIRQHVEAIYLATNAYKDAEQKLTNIGVTLDGSAFEKLSSGTVKVLSTKLADLYKTSGIEGVNQIKDNITKLTEGLTDEEKETFNSILGSIDWTDASAIEKLDEMLEAVGFNTSKLATGIGSFQQGLIKLSDAVYKTDLTQVIGQIQTMAETADKIHSGDKSISEDSYQQFIDAGLSKNKFFQMADSTYRFIGSTEELDQAIYESTENKANNLLHNIEISSGKQREQYQEDYRNLIGQIISTGNYNAIAAIDPKTLDLEQLKEYDKALIAIGLDYPELEKDALTLRDATNENEKAVLRLKIKSAIMNKSIEKDFKNLTTAISDNIDTLKNASKETTAYRDALAKIAAQARITFSNDSIDDKFIEKHIKDFEKMAEGDTGALKNIRNALIEMMINSEAAGSQTQYLLDIIKELSSKNIDIKAGIDISDIIADLGYASDEVTMFKQLLESLGYTVDQTTTKTIDPKTGAELYSIQTRVYDAAGREVKSHKPTTPSGSKSSKWENPYDELYNKVEESNEALRQRNKLENKYNDLLKSRASTQQEIQKAIFDEIANVRHEIDLQEQLLAGRQQQLATANQETYTNDKGKTKTFQAWGAEKYAWYNMEKQQVEINNAAIEKIKDSATGNMVSAWIDILKDYEDKIDEGNDTLSDMRNTLDDLYERGIDSYLELEQRVYDALVDKQQKQIDELQNISDAIDDAMSEVIDGIQEQIDAERQARENQKTEEDIADKEARLAFLKRDTSGANALEIKQLEKEIEDAREGYSDTIIDQTIEQIQKDADLAAEQRNRQIELLEAQLEFDKENGTFNNLVRDLYLDATDNEGRFDMNSELVSLLQQTDAFKGMSEFGQANWIKEMVEAFNNSVGGDINAKLVEARALGEVTTSSGQHFTYDTATRTWSDENNVKHSLNWDANTGYTASGNEVMEEEPVENHPYGYAKDLLKRTLSVKNPNMTGDDVSLLQWILEQEGYSVGDKGVDGRYGPATAAAVRAYQKDHTDADGKKLAQDGVAGPKTRASIIALNKYANGGLANFTGPAWLDGSFSKPELVLNAKDTQNFISLRDILASLFSQETQRASQGDNYFDIKINADIGSDYDVSRLAEQIREEIYNDSIYRNVNTISHLR